MVDTPSKVEINTNPVVENPSTNQNGAQTVNPTPQENKVVQTESKLTHINVVSSGKKSEELEKMLTELNIEDKSQPDVIRVNNKASSFGNRIRINTLVASDAEKWIGKVITTGGWIRTIRVQGGGSFCFVELNDGSSVKGLQVIVDKSIPEFEFLTNQSIGACVSFRGLIVKSPGKGQLVYTYNNLD
jgi:hypothetical protein